jgi:hypothetical protein
VSIRPSSPRSRASRTAPSRDIPAGRAGTTPEPLLSFRRRTWSEIDPAARGLSFEEEGAWRRGYDVPALRKREQKGVEVVEFADA